MASVTSGVGLISGIDSGSLIDKLIALEAKPRDLAQAQIDKSTNKKTALLGLSAQLLGLQGAAAALGSEKTFSARQATVSNPSVLSVKTDTGAVLGSTQFVAVRQAQAQQLISNGYPDTDSTKLSAGTISIKLGGFVNNSTGLNTLNGGSGVPLGKIQITNRAGAQNVVDLSAVKTVDDVISAINSTPNVGVRASVSGDRLVLSDTTGAPASPLRFNELGSTTAAALGLTTDTDGSDTTLTGSDIVRLSGSTKLTSLNDGLGVRRNASGTDFQLTLKDGSTVDVGIAAATTVQDVIDAINNDSENGGKVTASLAANNKSLKLTDNTAGGGTLAVSALNASHAAADLGILGSEQGAGVLTGKRTQATLNSVLLANLQGGSGTGTAGSIQLTDRSGQSASIDLSSAASLDDVVTAINNAGLGLSAAINSAGDGLQVTDTTGSTSSNLIISDTTGTLAASLNIAVNASLSSVNSGDLNARYISSSTRLDGLNGGEGVQRGKFNITDSLGRTRVVDLSSSSVETIGDVIQAINSSGSGVLASINSTGDGILVTDTAGGGAQLRIDENGGRTAADLHLLGSGTGSIDGAFRYTLTVTAEDTLQTLFNKIASAPRIPINASLTNDGSANDPYRMIIGSTRSGAAGRLLIDTGSTGLNFSTLAAGQDALLQVGTGGTPLLFASSDNSFQQVLTGVSVTLLGSSKDPVAVNVAQDNSAITTALQGVVDRFNSTVDAIDKATTYDSTTTTAATLFNDSTTLQIQIRINNLVLGNFGPAAGSIHNLTDLGISFSDGKLQFDTSRLDQALDDNPAAVKDFFKTSSTGLADQFKTGLTGLTDSFSGIIAQRTQSIDQDVTNYQQRLVTLNASLDARRALLQAQFNAMEAALAALKSQSSALGGIQNLFNTTTSSSSSS